MIKLSFYNLFRRKTRTFLSVLGIAIGVAAIIVLVSLVDGFTQDFDSVISQFKGLQVVEKDVADQIYSRIDASYEDKIDSIPEVKAAIPELWILPNKIDGKPLYSNISIYAYGTDIGKYGLTGSATWFGEVEKGSNLKPTDSGMVVIGSEVAGTYNKFVGSPIDVDGERFMVKGILPGGSLLVDGAIIMNMSDARKISALDSDKIGSLFVTLHDFSKDEKVGNLIELKYDELEVFTNAELSEQFNSIIGNLRLLAIAVALISSIVAGIGIANTILMSVLERFGEIGALKAVGWARENVIKMILYESLFMGVIGGIAGILLGFGVDALIAAVANVKYYVSPQLLLEAFGFALLLGLVSGIYPAYYASNLSPVDALKG